MSAKRITILYTASIAAALLSSGCIVKAGVDAGDPVNAEFWLTWETVDSATSREVDCVSAGADTVWITASNVTTGDEFIDLFNCRDERGSSFPFTAGNYWVTVELLWCGGGACDRAVAISPASTVGPYRIYDNVAVDLGHFVFLINSP
jgi:hypothetical protein